MKTERQKRIVIAGQVPPPYGGQNIAIARLLHDFQNGFPAETLHLSFEFTHDFKQLRTGTLSKAWELLKVLLRLFCIRMGGPIDLLIFPAGGPQTIPVIRDIFLLPWILLACRAVVLQFHAAGASDRFASCTGILYHALGPLYRACPCAIVMTEFNRRDPEFFGIRRIEVIPHQMGDEFDARFVVAPTGKKRLLYLGHLCADKGTPALIEAFARVARTDASLELELVGETLTPFRDGDLHGLIERLGMQGRIHTPGLLTGDAKREVLGRASLFVFPSIAPYESFGLVLIEAMMWGLPIVATDWRGNADVTGRPPNGLLVPMETDFISALAATLAEAVASAAQWPAWGAANRCRFAERFCQTSAKQSGHARLAESLLFRELSPKDSVE